MNRASRGLLLETGHRLLRQQLGALRGRNPRQRLADAVKKLNGSKLGIAISEEPGQTVIRSCSCPIGSVTSTHPEVCALLASVLSELLGAQVTESCQRGASTRCCFQLAG